MRRSRWTVTVGLGTALVASGVTAANAADPPLASVAKRFTYTGAVESYVVPAGVTSATVQVVGASGGDNQLGANVFSVGGKGVSVTGDVVVAPGDVFTVGVGGRGGVNGVTAGAGGWGSTAQYTGGEGGTVFGNG